MKIEIVDINSIKENKENVNTHNAKSIEKIMRSIKAYGLNTPLGVWKNIVIVGNGRYQALKKPGYEKVPIVRLDHLSKEEAKAYAIADNRIQDESFFNEEALKGVLSELEALNFDLEPIGFDEDELNLILDENLIENIDKKEANDIPIVLDERVVIKQGDLIKIGEHRLLCGDSTKIEDVKKLINKEKIDLVVTDPPYNVDIEGKAGKILNDNMGDESFYKFLLKVFRNYFEVMREGAVIYVFHADTERINFTKAFKESGLKLSQILIWNKESATLSRQDYNWKHEPILYGWKEGEKHYFCKDFTQTTIIDDIDYKKMNKNELINEIKKLKEYLKETVIENKRPTISELHPTMKPVELISKLIFNSSQRGWNVLDLFGGSGSTLIACEIMKRKAYLMELDAKYCQVIIQRWCDYTGMDDVKINGKRVKWSNYKESK